MPTSLLTSRRALLHAATAAFGTLAVPGLAIAASWPSKPIRIVVPFNAGGATDLLARTFAEALSQRIGQTVLVDNKPGASGGLGTAEVAKAAADGHTLLVSLSTSMLINQFLYSKLPYNPQKDLLMLSQIAAAPVTLVVHPSVPANNMQELLAYVKANKGKLSYGSWGAGSYAHLAGAYMSKSMQADMVHASYRGEAPMLQDLIGGQLHLCFSSALNTRSFIESGQLKAIGVTGLQRMQILPDVPTIHEQGITDDAYSVFGWVAIGAPMALPADIAAQLSAHIQEIAKEPKMIQRVTDAGFTLMMNSPEAFRENYQKDMPIWKRLVETAEAKLD